MKHFLSSLVPWKLKNLLYHLPQAVLANFVYGFPSRKLKVIGVTGTNGKTTTTQFVARILEAAGKKIAVASTIDFQIGEKRWVNASKFTTLGDFKLQKFLREAVDAGCEYAVLETSSHSLDQYRVWGIRYDIAVVTNVTREHLDYHKTMEAYACAKRRLFEAARFGVVNLDMEYADEFLAVPNEKKLTYSTTDSRADLLAEDIHSDMNGSTFSVEGERFELRLPGLFNIENALAAIGVGRLVGVDLPTMCDALLGVTLVPGRMEAIPNHLGLRIFVDYAVTPDSLEKVYALVTKMKDTGRIIAVMGACGERDRGKRPMMGEIVSSYADFIILTNEDPYHEDPKRIVHEVEKGIKGKVRGEQYFKVMDRRAAIHKALSLAHSGDTVMVTGKGAEETMAIGNERIPWNDRTVIGEELGKMR